jgi:6-pyruvoyltetrahydropterin/6-carboxytetrahydropterin synthase
MSAPTPSPARIAQVCCEFWFEASHQLFRPDWTEEQNLAVFGKCVRMHGHSYHLKVAFRGPIDPETGMVVNFFDVKTLVRERVIDRLDHYHMNDVVEGIPTAENLAYWIAGQLTEGWKGEGVELSRIELWETRSAYAFLDREDLARLR